MDKTLDLLEHLNVLSQLYPNKVIRKLDNKSIIQRGSDQFYEIDDSDIDKKLGDFPDGAIPYAAIHSAFASFDDEEVSALFKGSKQVPFSKAYKSRLGLCLEKAILTQLSAQRGRDSFLINGLISEDSDNVVGYHSYNVVFKDKKPFLVDTQNPLEKDSKERIIRPYIIPILDLVSEYREFILPNDLRNKRKYSIF